MFRNMNTDIETDKELRTMRVAHQILSDVDKQMQIRIISWLQSKLGIDAVAKQGELEEERPIAPTSKAPFELASTDKQKVLAAAIKLVESGSGQFTSRQVAQKLREVGVVISNLTRTMTELVRSRPPLLIQLRKQGKTMQGRRLFMLSSHGKAKAAGLNLGLFG